MTASKTERLLNLLIMLLVQRHYVSKERIREILYADAPSTDAFEKTFERDKDELRSLGVPIEVGQMDAYFDDEPGYRIRADQFALPEISLESDEAQVSVQSIIVILIQFKTQTSHTTTNSAQFALRHRGCSLRIRAIRDSRARS